VKLRAIYVEGFGVWHKLRLEGFQDGLNLIYGPNEAGKTTLLEFVRAILYGFTLSGEGYLPPLRAGRAGGWLEVVCPDGLFRIQRLLTEEELQLFGSARADRPEDAVAFPAEMHREASSAQSPGVPIGVPNPQHPPGIPNSYRPNGGPNLALPTGIPHPQGSKDIPNPQRPTGILNPQQPNGAYILPSDSAARLGQLRILGPHGIVEEGGRLAGWLGGVDETIFQNIFAIGLRELQQLALLSQTEAASLLYALSAGMDRVNLLEVTKELQQARHRILAPGDGPCLLADLFARREKLRRQMQSARQSAAQYPQLLAQRQQADQQAQQLQAELTQLQQQMRLLETALAVRDRIRLREQLDAQWAALPPGKPVSAEMLRQFQTLQQAIQEHQAELARLRAELAQLREQEAATAIDKQIIMHSASIQALVQQLPWLQTLEERLAALQEEIRLLEAKLAEQTEQLGLPEPEGLEELHKQTNTNGEPRLWERLREPAGRIRQLRRQVQQAQQQAAAARQTAEALQEQLQQALADRGYQDLGDALAQTSQQLANLRRRQQIDQQLAQIQRRQRELAAQLQHRHAHPSPSVAERIGWVALLLVGIGLAGWGGILPGLGFGAWNLLWASLGVVLSVGAVLGNLLLQQHRRRHFQTCNQQRKMLQRQASQLEEERRALDAAIPPGSGSLAQHIDTLQRELALLEQLTPLNNRREAAWQEVQWAEAHLQSCQQQLQTAYQRWQEALQLLGLPPTLSPAQALRWQAQADRLAELHQRLQQTRGQYAQEQQQWEELRDRIRQLADHLGLQPAHLNPVELVRLMAERLRAEEAQLRERRQWRRQLRAVRRQEQRLRRQLARLARQRRRLFRQAGVRSEEAFGQRAALTQQAEQLALQRQQVQQEIEAILAGRVREEDMAPYLDADLDLAAQQAQLAEQIAQRTQQLQACHERRGELAEQIRRLAEDRSLAELRAEWDQLEREIAQTGRRWQVLALTSRLLEELRRRYERQYQPETLQEASEYFRRMSQGRYQRVWRPLDREELWVDLTEGGSLPVDRLSHGTRELLYLSLRLALAAAYARRGIRLPMILDDVMVNFDAGRAQATAELLRDFALQGHQILLFTCHQHLQALFQSLRVPQATLPDWSQQPTPRVRLEIPSAQSVLPVPKNRRRKTLAPPPAKPEGPEDSSGTEESFGPQMAGAPSESAELVCTEAEPVSVLDAESVRSAQAKPKTGTQSEMRTDVPTESEPVGQAEPETLAQAEPHTDVPSEPACSACSEPSEASNPDDDFQWYDRLVDEEDGWPHDGWPGQTGPEETWLKEAVPPLAQQDSDIPPDDGPPPVPGPSGGSADPRHSAEAEQQNPPARKPAVSQKPEASEKLAASKKLAASEHTAASEKPAVSEKLGTSGHSPTQEPDRSAPARSSALRRSAEAA